MLPSLLSFQTFPPRQSLGYRIGKGITRARIVESLNQIVAYG
jgi:hypothetical protein